MDDREWAEAARSIIPLFSLAVATAAFSLQFQRLSITGKVRYQDSGYLVAVRRPGEWYDIRDFVQPYSPEVQRIYGWIGPSVEGCLDFVCQNISYRKDVGEYWQFPVETLARGIGDCEDTSVLLTSLLRNFTDACVVLGNYSGYGHAWVETGHTVLESTYTQARRVADAHNYQPFCYFNDVQVVELYPGALQEVFQIKRDEAAKLNLIARELTRLDKPG